MATQNKADVFQNVKFTAGKKLTHKEVDVEFQGSENDVSANGAAVKIQDNGHSKSKIQKFLQSKEIWVVLNALVVLILFSGIITAIVYSQQDSTAYSSCRLPRHVETSLTASLGRGHVTTSDVVFLLDRLKKGIITFDYIDELLDVNDTFFDKVRDSLSRVRPEYQGAIHVIKQAHDRMENGNGTLTDLLALQVFLEKDTVSLLNARDILGKSIPQSNANDMFLECLEKSGRGSITNFARFIDRLEGNLLARVDLEKILDQLKGGRLTTGVIGQLMASRYVFKFISTDDVFTLVDILKKQIITPAEMTKFLDKLKRVDRMSAKNINLLLDSLGKNISTFNETMQYMDRLQKERSNYGYLNQLLIIFNKRIITQEEMNVLFDRLENTSVKQHEVMNILELLNKRIITHDETNALFDRLENTSVKHNEMMTFLELLKKKTINATEMVILLNETETTSPTPHAIMLLLDSLGKDLITSNDMISLLGLLKNNIPSNAIISLVGYLEENMITSNQMLSLIGLANPSKTSLKNIMDELLRHYDNETTLTASSSDQLVDNFLEKHIIKSDYYLTTLKKGTAMQDYFDKIRNIPKPFNIVSSNQVAQLANYFNEQKDKRRSEMNRLIRRLQAMENQQNLNFLPFLKGHEYGYLPKS